ncbi:hypothetical protein EVAR_67540_1 [Eumeta japonica]|uniref:Uncharacterized protein n=1 Tax=Eumeta variegata TaxID=151549 RepID=A0A4C2A0I8_EUMVA|nr:hypothetical protein EVAR_67540_1 [Eumeta japonica]
MYIWAFWSAAQSSGDIKSNQPSFKTVGRPSCGVSPGLHKFRQTVPVEVPLPADAWSASQLTETPDRSADGASLSRDVSGRWRPARASVRTSPRHRARAPGVTALVVPPPGGRLEDHFTRNVEIEHIEFGGQK